MGQASSNEKKNGTGHTPHGVGLGNRMREEEGAKAGKEREWRRVVHRSKRKDQRDRIPKSLQPKKRKGEARRCRDYTGYSNSKEKGTLF